MIKMISYWKVVSVNVFRSVVEDKPDTTALIVIGLLGVCVGILIAAVFYVVNLRKKRKKRRQEMEELAAAAASYDSHFAIDSLASIASGAGRYSNESELSVADSHSRAYHDEDNKSDGSYDKYRRQNAVDVRKSHSASQPSYSQFNTISVDQPSHKLSGTHV